MLVYNPQYVGWRWRHGNWEAGCSGDSRGAVTRKLLDFYGDDADTLVLPLGTIPTEPPQDTIPQYGKAM